MADPDQSAIENGLGEFLAYGANELDGNNIKAARGTGFFIDKFGRFVTARHVVADLEPGVHREGMTLSVTPRACDSRAREAAIMYENANADLMVLIVDTENCTGITPLNKVSLLEGKVKPTMPMWSAGYYDSGHVAWYAGTVSSMNGHPSPPRPRLLCDFTLDGGQSGSPVVAHDGRVFGVAVASQSASLRPSLVTPITEVPPEHFANAGNAVQAQPVLTVAAVESAPVVVVRAQVPVAPRARIIDIDLGRGDDACSGTDIPKRRVTAISGWEIDPASVRLTQKAIYGAFADADAPKVTTTKDAVVVSGKMLNLGQCVKVKGGKISVARPSSYQGELTFTEIPSSKMVAQQELGSARVIPGVNTGLAALIRAQDATLSTTVRTPELAEAQLPALTAKRATVGKPDAIRDVIRAASQATAAMKDN